MAARYGEGLPCSMRRRARDQTEGGHTVWYAALCRAYYLTVLLIFPKIYK